MDDATTSLLAAGVEMRHGKLRVGRGRQSVEPVLGETRELTVEDFAHAAASDHVTKSVPIKDLRQSHHQLARLLAGGLPDAEVSVITGYSISRISILKSDPTFAELRQYYADMEAEQHKLSRADMHERLASIGFDAVETLHQRLVEEPESFDNKTLLAVIEASADRTGYGKTSTVNSNVSHSLSDEALARIRQATAANVQVSETDRGTLLGIASRLTAEEHSTAEEADWEPSAGGGVREESDEGAGPEDPGQHQLPSVD